ncbi:radical SAM protein [Candidatus Woesearchaeota archaeon]|nr:radical SAM protein [Candidatus Woesearchaeota archaeon]
MTKTLLIYPPFCTPAAPPYSIANIHAFLKNNIPAKHELAVLDLNLEFHCQKFANFRRYYERLDIDYNREEYSQTTEEFKRQTEKVYSQNNKAVIDKQLPELFDELLQLILDEKPDIVAFSIVYSSQAFYATALIRELKKLNIRTVIGGPAINEKLIRLADATLRNELELLSYIEGREIDHNALNFKTVIDYSIFPLHRYFTPEPVLPYRTSSACYYRQCAFCTHFGQAQYFEYPLENIRKSIHASKARYIFITDDMIHKQRLLDIAAMLKPLKVSWLCQLRPTKDLDKETLKTLKDSGLKVILWGIESGCDRILKLMKKGTNRVDIAHVLKHSKAAGICNGVYVIFGFPSETEEELIETVDFLNDNRDNIDLISTSIFGLQKGSAVYAKPEEFGIKAIIEEKRTILEPKITYTLKAGITPERASELKRRYRPVLESINRFPKTMNFFREHMLVLS